MTHPILFSSGIELSPLVISSGLLLRSWDVIASRHDNIVSDEGLGLSWKLYKQPGTDVVILAFEASSDSSSKLQPDLVPYSDLLLSTKSNPEFSVNNTAVTLFYENHQKLAQLLKSEINLSNQSNTKLIVTGHGLGGSVASLFTISLLDNVGSGKKRPLCITFGSPLVGDKKLQQAISRSAHWNSCFLHVVSHKDPLPRLFIANSYMPFGTFLFCSDKSSTCFENPDSSLEILVQLGSINAQSQGNQSSEYGNIIENLKPICKDLTTRAEDKFQPDSLLACISLQLQALGLTPQIQQQQQNIDINALEAKMKKLEEKLIVQRRIIFDPSKKLNQMKGHMAQLEWYKKETKDEGKGYYDSYKNMYYQRDHDVVELHKKLTIYWEKMVEEAKLKPQREGSAFRTRYLYGGTTYRRMVEPLAISQYYKDGGDDYMKKKRSKHFELLEEWLNEAGDKDKKNLQSTSKKNVQAILTIDSCFWAHVEEALLSCKELKAGKEKEEAVKKLLKFEDYIYGVLKNYEVSPEIFLEQSSFMRWWIEYKGIKGTSYSSPLASFMNDVGKRKGYIQGTYDFP
ncbi:senescence-associated carboxylesterase 101-like isoform X2 [Lotus japonicus]|uniref:senescence-associated carboxylesterase 101-like isoform X2 n=1 Tax=Lotus japonicus TaxID=34305 RepID=UPI00258978E0|nr:senescence-associated carboxylesterase 101-like isoform X2 [Lotus japonicus]